MVYSRYLKRILDFVFALLLSPALLIAYVFIGTAIKLEDGGPVFYCGKRLGQFGKPFEMFKFRSMKVNAPDWRLEDVSTFNSADDPRQTKVGKFLRTTSIDEIPQIINILRGDMSFIGPRPDPVDWLERYTEEDKEFLNVRPGITGYSQAYFRNSADGREKVENDVFYALNISLAFDIRILFSTFIAVLVRKNVFKPSEQVGTKSDGV